MTTLRRHQEHHYPQTRERLNGVSHVRHSPTAPRGISDYHHHSHSHPHQSSPSIFPEFGLTGYETSRMSSCHPHQHSRHGSDPDAIRGDDRRDSIISQYHRDISFSTRHLSITDEDTTSHREGIYSTFHKRLPVAPMLKPTGGELPPIKGRASRDDVGGHMLPSIRSTLGDIGIVEHDLPERNSRLSFSRHGLSPPMSPEERSRRSASSPHSSTLPLSQVLSPGDASLRNPPRHTVESPASTHASTASSEPPQMPTLQGGSFICKYAGCKAPPFQTQYLLNSHANVHSSARPHYCPVKGCPRSEGGKGFKRKNEMIRHGLVHDSPGYICPFCPDREHRYPRPDNLQRYV